ncbi:kinase/pyrophosphorylase [Peptoniphilus sp. GNH]|nr:hypothetical protein HMPREF3189_00119 [Clostridiales bacterium KA00134]UHR03084.1 kinase/pyrophosphorylase [Peptoniphilus sp. GNH]
MAETEIIIYVISDSIGETGELIAKSSVKQFEKENYEIKRFPYHNTVEQIQPILEEAAKQDKALIIYTNVQTDTRKYIQKATRDLNLKTVDVMGEPMQKLEEILGYPPLREPGLIRRLDDNYFKKVEAVEFAVKYDDGKDPRGIINSDICILGISRTSKTPLSMYLANKFYKVCNIPLVPEIPVPKEIFAKDPRRLVGLTADSEKIISIREERLKNLGLSGKAKYADLKRIRDEIEYANDIIDALGILKIDVTNKAIEETAEIIIANLKKNFG